ncbi:hypothetical protein [Paraprevotella clara]|uniref:hypothetical protein n=1 Tax=Paraprevotella clara TaxID=454154 RepID=UPI003AB8070B
MAGVKFDFSDVDSFFEQGRNEVCETVDKVGSEADDYDVKDGTYQNRTGTLRKSNRHKVEKDCSLILYNNAESPQGYHYASNVESKGFRVRSGGALYAEKRLKELIK